MVESPSGDVSFFSRFLKQIQVNGSWNYRVIVMLASWWNFVDDLSWPRSWLINHMTPTLLLTLFRFFFWRPQFSLGVWELVTYGPWERLVIDFNQLYLWISMGVPKPDPESACSQPPDLPDASRSNAWWGWWAGSTSPSHPGRRVDGRRTL